MNIQLWTGTNARRIARREQLIEAAVALNLTPTLIGRDVNFHAHFAYYYQQLRRLPRRVRRALGRKLPVSLVGAALLLALGQGQALAATITVDGASCTLVDAVTAANNDASAGGCSAGSGPDTIELLTDVTLSGVDNSTYDSTGLPVIASTITVAGNDFTIARDVSAPSFRLMAVGAGGNLTLNNVTLSGGETTGVQNGGGLYNYYGEVAIVDSTVSGNSSSNDGGGVFNQYGKVTLTHGTVSGNMADRYGGGLSNNGTFLDQVGEIILTNATVSGNTANYDAGGVDNVNGELTLTHSTVTGNSAVYYSGGLSNLYGTVTLSGSLVSGNIASQVAELNNLGLFGPPGPVYANNYNLFGHGGLDNNAAFAGFTPGATDINATSDGVNTPIADILDINLADNDGPTETHALVANSPALDQIPPNGDGPGCATTDPDNNPIATDQRGKSRPVNINCDIGAFEFEPTPPCAIIGDIEVTIATKANLSSGTEMPAICSNGDFVLGARSQLLDGGSVQALDAVTLKNGSLVTGDINTNTDVTLNPDATVNQKVTAGGDAHLKARARIGGDLFTTGVAQLNPNAFVDGTITEGAPPPDLTPTALPNCGVNAIGGESFRTRTGEDFGLLEEGDYGEVYFSTRNQVRLCGEYSFHSLRFGPKTEIEISCPTILSIAGDLIFNNGATQTLSGSATPETVVYRIDQGLSSIGPNVNLYGTLCAPDGMVKLGKGVRLEGALYGSKVKVGTGVQFMASPTILLED